MGPFSTPYAEVMEAIASAQRFRASAGTRLSGTPIMVVKRVEEILARLPEVQRPGGDDTGQP